MRRTGHRQRGNALLVALIALTGLISLAGLTVLSVQGGLATSSSERFNSIALYAAESGAAVAMDTLRKKISCTPSASSCSFGTTYPLPSMPADIPGNQKQPGDPLNLLHLNAWYEVEIVNNRGDTTLLNGAADTDGDLIIRSTGHGPDGATAQVEWEINGNKSTASSAPCPSYGQKDMAENGAGVNNCLSAVSATSTATYRPGGP